MKKSFASLVLALVIAALMVSPVFAKWQATVLYDVSPLGQSVVLTAGTVVTVYDCTAAYCAVRYGNWRTQDLVVGWVARAALDW